MLVTLLSVFIVALNAKTGRVQLIETHKILPCFALVFDVQRKNVHPVCSFMKNALQLFHVYSLKIIIRLL